MSGSTKRIWAPNISFEDANKLILDFLKKCREKNILTQKNTSLYHVYKKEGHWPIKGMTEVSQYIRFSKNDNPDTDRTRDSVIRLLSACLKAHCFFNEQGIVRNEPYIFSTPDLSKPGCFQYGIVYQIEEDNKSYSIVVADWDLNLSNSSFLKHYNNDYLPVVLSSNSFKWLEVKRWRELKKTEQSVLKISSWKDKFNYFNKINSITENDKFQEAGTPVSYSNEMKDFITMLGGEWARGIKSWFIPKEMDYPLAKEYLDFISSLSEEERYLIKWWNKSKYPEKNKTITK